MRRLATAGIVFTLLFALATPARASDDDVVLLGNGGRVRGSVVQEDPAQGVRIRLADGTIRDIAAKDVKKVQYANEPAAVEAPAPVAVGPVVAPPLQAGVGSIHIETSAPANVTVDGGLVGKTPADVRAAGVGRHRVHVDFDDGGSREQVILVQGGETSIVKLGLPPAQQAFEDRKGFRLGAEGGVIGPELTRRSGSDGVGFGVMATGFLNLGVAPAIDLRIGASIQGLAGVASGFALSIPGSIRFNFGSIYTMALGVDGGVEFYAPGSVNNTCDSLDCPRVTGLQPFGFIGPTVSLFGLRFGKHRQFEITLTHAILGFPGGPDDGLVYSQWLTFGGLFGAGS